MIVGAIADDLSGAAGVAGDFARFGLSACVMSWHALPAAAPNDDVIVIDTDSRGCSAEESASRHVRAATWLRPAAPRQLLLKIDSQLRGHPGANQLPSFVNAAYADPTPSMTFSRTLGLLWVSWLTSRPPVLDLPPKSSVQIAMHLSEEDLGSIGRYVLVYMPMATALLGGAVWLRRRTTEGKRVRSKPKAQRGDDD